MGLSLLGLERRQLSCYMPENRIGFAAIDKTKEG
jgi:hypothetical protein